MVRRVHLAIARALVRFLGPALEEREVGQPSAAFVPRQRVWHEPSARSRMLVTRAYALLADGCTGERARLLLIAEGATEQDADEALRVLAVEL